jgi:hypothetical protein
MPCRHTGEEITRFAPAYAEFKRAFEKCGDHWIPKQAFSPES